MLCYTRESVGKYDKPLSPEFATVKSWMRRIISGHIQNPNLLYPEWLWIFAMAMHTGKDRAMPGLYYVKEVAFLELAPMSARQAAKSVF